MNSKIVKVLLPMVAAFCSVASAQINSIAVGAPQMVLPGEIADPVAYFPDIVPNGCDKDACRFSTDASYATLRQKDGSTSLFNAGYSQQFVWRGSHVGDVDMAGGGIGKLVRATPTKVAFSPFRSDVNYVASVSDPMLAKRPDSYMMWTPNLYQISGDELLAFIHIEDWTSCNTFPNDLGHLCVNYPVYRIGLGYSRDGGNSWKWLGDIIRPSFNKNPFSNIGGIPYVTAGDYFQVYFNETVCSVVKLASDGKYITAAGKTTSSVDSVVLEPACPWNANKFIGVARAKIADVVEAARHGKAVAWNKYRNGAWTENALTGVGSNVILANPAGAGGSWDSHADAAYVPSLNRYILLGNWHPDNGVGAGVYLLSSTDGVTWNSPRLVLATPSRRHRQYATIVGMNDGVSSDDFRIVGKSFYVMYPDLNMKVTGGVSMFKTDSTGTELKPRISTDVYRVRVDLN